jgi:hypothetical protein
MAHSKELPALATNLIEPVSVAKSMSFTTNSKIFLKLQNIPVVQITSNSNVFLSDSRTTSTTADS